MDFIFITPRFSLSTPNARTRTPLARCFQPRIFTTRSSSSAYLNELPRRRNPHPFFGPRAKSGFGKRPWIKVADDCHRVGAGLKYRLALFAASNTADGDQRLAMIARKFAQSIQADHRIRILLWTRLEKSGRLPDSPPPPDRRREADRALWVESPMIASGPRNPSRIRGRQIVLAKMQSGAQQQRHVRAIVHDQERLASRQSCGTRAAVSNISREKNPLWRNCRMRAPLRESPRRPAIGSRPRGRAVQDPTPDKMPASFSSSSSASAPPAPARRRARCRRPAPPGPHRCARATSP